MENCQGFPVGCRHVRGGYAMTITRYQSRDRRVHATYTGMEVVRYERAGRWFLEPISGIYRQNVTVAEAVEAAVWGLARGGSFFPGRPGGKIFDAKVKEKANQ